MMQIYWEQLIISSTIGSNGYGVEKLIFINAKIYLEDEILENGWLETREGKVFDYGVGEKKGDVVNLGGKVLVPGFIDQHIHGANGCDVMDGTIEALATITAALPKEGVTGFLATTITQADENIREVLINIHDYIRNHNGSGAEVLGVHLEGPFISRDYLGAHLLEFVQKPTVEVFKKYETASGNTIRMVTLSPEEDEDHRLIRYLKDRGVVSSIGHSKASYREVEEAVQNGVKGVTHCYNAMTGIHHREIGVVGAALMIDELKVEIICDGIHVSNDAVRLLYKNKGKEEIILVTDAMRAKGLMEGKYELGGQEVILKGNEVRTRVGNLAGSVLKMNNAIKNMMTYTQCTLKEAVKMGSENPAKHLGFYHRKGSIDVGKDGDFVVLDENFDVVMTVCRGEIIYKIGDIR